MDIARVITQLKTYVPELKNRVAGAAEFATAAEQGYLNVPAAYVIPLADEADENRDVNGLVQEVTESMNIILVLDNTGDRRGQAATISVEQWKYKIHKAILNWRMDEERSPKGFYYDDASLGDMNAARLFWTMTYKQPVWIDESDGFIPPSTPLTHIDGKNPNLGDNSWSFDQTIPQD